MLGAGKGITEVDGAALAGPPKLFGGGEFELFGEKMLEFARSLGEIEDILLEFLGGIWSVWGGGVRFKEAGVEE